MGYAQCFSPCMRCGTIFGYNPHRVPAIRVDGEKEPLCRFCFERLNRQRIVLGLEPWPEPHPEAYEPIDETEL